jgi:outer membrane protein assembly complex protein YaeT
VTVWLLRANKTVPCVLFLAVATAVWSSTAALALTLEDLTTEKPWQVAEVVITGNQVFSQEELRAVLLTRQRPWYFPWKERPVFDPSTFAADLERLQRFYEARGYYETGVTYDLQVDDKVALVTALIQIQEGRPITVAAVDVQVASDAAEAQAMPALPEKLPLQSGALFTEEAYQQSEQVFREFFLQRGHTHVETQRKAEVDLAKDRARVWYTVQPGPQAVFGPTRVEGTKDVDPHLILRELTYQPGEQFSLQKIAESRQKILDLELFRVVDVAPEQTKGKPQVVPMRVRVEEKPQRDLKLGLKYSTEDEFGARAEWRHRNWLGGGRQLSLLLELSSVTRTLEAKFIQPYFLSPHTRLGLSLRQDQQDEDTFLLNATRFRPHLEHRFSPSLSAFLDYRLEFAKLNNIAPATIRALGGIKRDGILSGPSLGLIWNTTEDPFNPQEGGTISLFADQIGEIWGGDFKFYKITAEAKKYQRLGWQTVLAGRLKVGLADSFGAQTNIPLFERFYAGGEKSVRGYGRRRLGPLSDSDDPLGGLSLVEGSVELRRPLWRELSGALFLDFGQVSLDSFDLPVDDLKFAAGVGISYATPIGPLRLDIGFPFDPPRGDQAWQVHFSIGQFF